MRKLVKRVRLPILTLGACLLAASASWGAVTEVFLRAATVTKTMPDGRQVVLWGFAQDPNGSTQTGVVTVPGPALTLPPGPTQQDLLIHLRNTLAEPVSIIVPGLTSVQPLGDPQRNPDNRIRAFTHEVAPGATADYRWNNVPAGTYLYHSGSHPAKQVQMGLYGALAKPNTATQAYAGAPTHQGEVTLLFSAIDADLHDAVATGNYGLGQAVSSTLKYAPQYFMINGQCYTAGQPALPAVTLGAGGASRTVLLRLLNADIDYHVPVLNGAYLDVVAEDGKLYPFKRTQNQVWLPALKTMDAYWTADAAGTFPLFDRRLGLQSGPNLPGGMLTYLTVAAAP